MKDDFMVSGLLQSIRMALHTISINRMRLASLSADIFVSVNTTPVVRIATEIFGEFLACCYCLLSYFPDWLFL